MKHIIFLFGLLSFIGNLNAQDNNASKIKFDAIGSLQLGTIVGKNSAGINRTDFSIAGNAGIRLKQNIETSLGINVLIFDEFTQICPAVKVAYIPFHNLAIQPFIETNLGHSFVSETTYENSYYTDFKKRGGFYSASNVGVRIKNDNSYIGITAGFLHSWALVEWGYEWSSQTDRIAQSYNRWFLGFSFGF